MLAVSSSLGLVRAWKAPVSYRKGMSTDHNRDHDGQLTYRALLTVTLLLSVAVLLWGLGSIPLMSVNEARRAVPLQEMLVSGDWLLPTLNGQLYIAKPPLLYWLTATLATLTGSSGEWVVRLPSALTALAVIWWAHALVRATLGRWPALFFVLVLVGNAGFAGFGRRGEIEMLLAALCGGALLAVFRFLFLSGGRGWLLLSYTLLALAVLTKGPVALLFVTLPLLVHALLTRDRRVWSALGYWPGWLAFVVVAAPWYLAVVAKVGLEPWHEVVLVDVLGKVNSISPAPIYGYPLWVLGDFLPWSLLLLATPRGTWRCWRSQRELVFLLVAVLAPLLMLSLFDEKHAKYLLPAYLPLAVLVGARLAQWYQQFSGRSRAILLGGAVLVVTGYLGWYVFVEARFYDYRIVVLPQLADYFRTQPQPPVYAYPGIDPRAVYYRGQPVPVHTLESLQAMSDEGQSLRVLVPDKAAQPLLQTGWCSVAEFSPYLGRNKTLMVLGTGAVCNSAPAGVAR